MKNKDITQTSYEAISEMSKAVNNLKLAILKHIQPILDKIIKRTA